MNDAVPRYQQVKDYICERIDHGIWTIDQRVPSEHELVAELGVSRMTVNRAVRELTDLGRLRRVQGLGTFVADPRPRAELLEIRNIADEISSRGHRHHCDVEVVGSRPANDEDAAHLVVEPGAEIFHSLIVHFENDRPVQVEDRLVNPAVAPDYLKIDFSTTTPNEYLMKVAPLADVEHTIDAVLPDLETRTLLQISEGEPCLLLHRQTWSRGQVASRAWLTHPSSRYRLGARFSQDDPSSPYPTLQTIAKGAAVTP